MGKLKLNLLVFILFQSFQLNASEWRDLKEIEKNQRALWADVLKNAPYLKSYIKEGWK